MNQKNHHTIHLMLHSKKVTHSYPLAYQNWPYVNVRVPMRADIKHCQLDAGSKKKKKKISVLNCQMQIK